MTAAWTAAALILGSVAGAALSVVVLRRVPAGLLVENRSGRMVPAVLGWALVAGVVMALAVVQLWWTAPTVRAERTLLLAGVGAAVVHAAGFLDDLRGQRARGFRGHLGSLLRGRPTTGVVKLAVGVAVGVALAVWMGGGPVRVAASAVLIVVSINVWNALDVVPGRALKWAIVALAGALAGASAQPGGVVAGAAVGAAMGVLPFDLTERGMLGDAGSNPLGLLAGLALALALPTWGILIGAGAALALQVVAETVTISWLIEAVPPLRWFDRLGRSS